MTEVGFAFTGIIFIQGNLYHKAFVVRNFCGSVANCYFIIKHLRLLLVIDLRVMPIMEIIGHEILILQWYKNCRVRKNFLLQKFCVIQYMITPGHL